MVLAAQERSRKAVVWKGDFSIWKKLVDVYCGISMVLLKCGQVRKESLTSRNVEKGKHALNSSA